MFQRALMCAAALALSVMVSGVCAAEPGVEITPFIAQRAGGGFNAADGSGANLSGKLATALAVDWPTTESGAQYELLYSRQSTQTDGATPINMRIEYLQLGGTTLMGDETSHVVPFAAGGLGAARFSPGLATLSQETRWAFNLGGGVRVPLSKHVRLRFEVRGYLTWLNGSSNLFCNSSTSCELKAKGQTLFQYEALGGVSVGF